MSKRHLKTINAPKNWPVKRKSKFWITRPNPGPHSLKQCLPLSVIFTELLGYTRTVREVKKILNQKVVLVNGIVRQEYKFPVGIFDILEFPDECYRLLYNKRGKFYLDKAKKEDKSTIPLKVIDKNLLKKGKVQLNFSNGNNLLTDKKEVKPGDSVLLGEKKVKDILKFEKGAQIYLTGGKYIGVIGKVEMIEENKMSFSKGKEKYETLKKYAFVIGKDKPVLDINENE